MVEVKAVQALRPEHQAQVINYLRATGYEVGLLVNFGMQKLQLQETAQLREAHPEYPVHPVPIRSQIQSVHGLSLYCHLDRSSMIMLRSGEIWRNQHREQYSDPSVRCALSG